MIAEPGAPDPSSIDEVGPALQSSQAWVHLLQSSWASFVNLHSDIRHANPFAAQILELRQGLCPLSQFSLQMMQTWMKDSRQMCRILMLPFWLTPWAVMLLKGQKVDAANGHKSCKHYFIAFLHSNLPGIHVTACELIARCLPHIGCKHCLGLCRGRRILCGALQQDQGDHKGRSTL